MHLRAVTVAVALVLTGVTTVWRKGVPYVDPGATAYDAYDGACPVRTSGHVHTTRRGAYTITYRASDRSGNTATATRTVVVR
jgi:hypothetical protein